MVCSLQEKFRLSTFAGLPLYCSLVLFFGNTFVENEDEEKIEEDISLNHALNRA